MGCFGSKQADIEEPRGRVATGQTQGTPSKTTPIGAGGRGGNDINDSHLLATSPLDARLGEHDYFTTLVERTAQDLINVSQNVEELETTDVADRQRDYSSLVKNVTLSDGVRVFALPSPSASNTNAAAILSAPLPISADYVEQTKKLSRDVSAALAAISVKDCGELVVSLQDIGEL